MNDIMEEEQEFTEEEIDNSIESLHEVSVAYIENIFYKVFGKPADPAKLDEMMQYKKEKLMKRTTIILDEQDFKCLVRGGILYVGTQQIALQDVGFDRMEFAIQLARMGEDTGTDHIKEL